MRRPPKLRIIRKMEITDGTALLVTRPRVAGCNAVGDTHAGPKMQPVSHPIFGPSWTPLTTHSYSHRDELTTSTWGCHRPHCGQW